MENELITDIKHLQYKIQKDVSDFENKYNISINTVQLIKFESVYPGSINQTIAVKTDISI